MSKLGSPKRAFRKRNAWDCRAESPIPHEMPNPERRDCRTERAHFSRKPIYVKEPPLPETKKRRCLTRCYSLRNQKLQKVQEVKQKQIRRDARQESDMTRSEAHWEQVNTKKPYFPWETVFFSCFCASTSLFLPLSFCHFSLFLSLSHSLYILFFSCNFLYFSFFISEVLAQLASNLQNLKTL